MSAIFSSSSGTGASATGSTTGNTSNNNGHNNHRNGVQVNGNLNNRLSLSNHAVIASGSGSGSGSGIGGSGVNGLGAHVRRRSSGGFAPGASGSGSAGFAERVGAGYGYPHGPPSASGSECGSRASSSKHQEELINWYEAEEERIVNVLSKKLEQLREDKIELENALEAESESHVNKLSRELVKLRARNRELEDTLEAQKAQNAPSTSSGPPTRENGNPASNATTNINTSPSGLTTAIASTSNLNLNANTRMVGADPSPSAMMVLDALRRENEQLRHRLVGTEREYVRLKRLNEVYREELIECRGRLGLPVDNLIGLTPADRDPFSQPTHLRGQHSNSSTSDIFAPWDDGHGHVHGHANGSGRVDDRTENHNDGNRSSAPNSPSYGEQGITMAMSYKPRFLGGGGYGESLASSSRTNSATNVTRGGSSSSQVHAALPSPVPHQHTVPIPLPRPASRIRRQEHATLMGVNGDVVADVEDEVDEVIEDEGEADGDESDEEEELEGTEVDSVPVSSTSSSSSASLYVFSPPSSVAEHRHHHHGHHHHGRSGQPGSYASVDTDVTSPPSSASFGLGMGVPGIPGPAGIGANGNGVGMGGAVMGGMGMNAYMVPQRGLTYPSVPPPSLSSSFGSPSVGFYGLPGMSRDASAAASPVESFSLSRRGSNAGAGPSGVGRRGSESGGVSGRRVVETGTLGLRRGSLSNHGPVPAGGRVAETGTLQRRSRAGSVGFATGSGVLPDTVDELDADDSSLS